MHPDLFPPVAPPVARAPQPEAAPKRQASGFFFRAIAALQRTALRALDGLADFMVETADLPAPPTKAEPRAPHPPIPEYARHTVSVTVQRRNGPCVTLAAAVPAWARADEMISQARLALINADQFHPGDQITLVRFYA